MPKTSFDFARCVCKARLGERLSFAGYRGGFWELRLDRFLLLAALRIAEGFARKTFLGPEQLGIFIRSKSNPI